MLLIIVALYTLIEIILSCTLICYICRRFSWLCPEETATLHPPVIITAAGRNYSWNADGYDKVKLYTALPYVDVWTVFPGV